MAFRGGVLRLDKGMHRKVRAGFTLVELLVVIAIMAVLISILVPALTQAKYQAMRTQCLANVKAQHLAQYLYAQDNEGKFAPHNGGPGSARAYGEGKDDCIYGLFKDSVYMENPQILLCPILASRLSFLVGTTDVDRSPLTCFRKLEMINEISDSYANWNYEEDPEYLPSADYDYSTGAGKYGYVGIGTGYLWFANCGGVDPGWFKFEYNGMPVNTTPWPRNLREAREDAAMITHGIVESTPFSTDYSHKGAGFSYEIPSIEDFSETADNPVGYGDGHVDMVPRPDVQPRANLGGIYFY